MLVYTMRLIDSDDITPIEVLRTHDLMSFERELIIRRYNVDMYEEQEIS